LPVSIYNTSDENINFFWFLNLIPNIISTILKLINEQKLILKKIDDISKNILTDQERHKKYSSAHLTSDWSEKKLRNIDKNNILNLESIKENKKKLELLLLDINYHTDNLYKLDKNLFDSNGICKLYSEIKKSDVL
jgi:mRNA-degrading endonuclease YafQ of YafQ-DinJ toxin-antitoxin module